MNDLFRIVRESSLIVVGALIAAGLLFFLHPGAPALYAEDEPLKEGEVTRSMVTEQWQDQVVWIDARPSAEFDEEHVEGAISLGPHNIETGLYDHFETLTGQGLPLVIYCGSRGCQASHKVFVELKEKLPGVEIHVLRGGWKAVQPLEVERNN